MENSNIDIADVIKQLTGNLTGLNKIVAEYENVSNETKIIKSKVVKIDGVETKVFLHLNGDVTIQSNNLTGYKIFDGFNN